MRVENNGEMARSGVGRTVSVGSKQRSELQDLKLLRFQTGQRHGRDELQAILKIFELSIRIRASCLPDNRARATFREKSRSPIRQIRAARPRAAIPVTRRNRCIIFLEYFPFQTSIMTRTCILSVIVIIIIYTVRRDHTLSRPNIVRRQTVRTAPKPERRRKRPSKITLQNKKCAH